MPLKFSVRQSEVISGVCHVNIHVKCSVVLKACEGLLHETSVFTGLMPLFVSGNSLTCF